MYAARNTSSAKLKLIVPRIANKKLTSRNNRKNINSVQIRNLIEISRGQSGKVLFGYMNKNLKNPIIRKVSLHNYINLNHEYLIHKKIYSIVPNHVVKPLKMSGRNLNLEYAPGGTLDRFIDLNKNRLTDEYMAMLIIQVIKTMQTIHKKDPSFRHNDLMIQNILVDDEVKKNIKINATGVRILLSDFGLAWDSQYKNPFIDPNWKTKLGIYVGNNKYYDIFLFFLTLSLKLGKLNICKKCRDILNYILNGASLIPKEGRLKNKYTKMNYQQMIQLFKGEKNNINNVINISGLFITPPIKYNRNFLMKFKNTKKNLKSIPTRIRKIIPKPRPTPFKSKPKPIQKNIELLNEYSNINSLKRILEYNKKLAEVPKQKNVLNIFKKGKSIQNMAEMNLRTMFPTKTNSNFMKHLGFIPRKLDKKPINATFLRAPVPLKNKAVEGRPVTKVTENRFREVLSAKKPEAWEKARELLKKSNINVSKK